MLNQQASRSCDHSLRFSFFLSTQYLLSTQLSSHATAPLHLWGEAIFCTYPAGRIYHAYTHLNAYMPIDVTHIPHNGQTTNPRSSDLTGNHDSTYTMKLTAVTPQWVQAGAGVRERSSAPTAADSSTTSLSIQSLNTL
jgi:hypothetical protein